MALKRVPTNVAPRQQDIKSVPEETVTVVACKTRSKHKGGRHPLEESRRSHQIKLSLNDHYAEKLDDLIKQTGENASFLMMRFLDGTGQRLKHKVSTEEFNLYKQMMEQTQRLGAVINQFNKISKSQNAPSPFELNEVLQMIQTALRGFQNKISRP